MLQGIIHYSLSGAVVDNAVDYNQLNCQYLADTEEKLDKNNDENGNVTTRKPVLKLFQLYSAFMEQIREMPYTVAHILMINKHIYFFILSLT